jgi:predicted metal-binding protein
MKQFKKSLLKKLYTNKKLNKEELEYSRLVTGRDCSECAMCRYNLMVYLEN